MSFNKSSFGNKDFLHTNGLQMGDVENRKKQCHYLIGFFQKFFGGILPRHQGFGGLTSEVDISGKLKQCLSRTQGNHSV